MSWSRRQLLLRGAGVALALPVLRSALPRASWAAAPESAGRFLAFYVPNGIQMPWFTPTTEGAGFALPDILRSLEGIEEHVSVLTGFANLQAEQQSSGDHARGTGSFLTCSPIRHTAGNDIENGVSVDQAIAQAKGHETLLPSLQVGIQPGGNTGDCTAGYSCAYTRNIAWASPTTPLPNITDPQVLFDRMFGVDVGLDPDKRALRKQLRASILDEVATEATSLQTRLGLDDKAKLDEYLTAVREVEVRVSALGGGGCEPGERPPSATLAHAEHVETMTDLMVLALQCDLTRVATFMLGPGASNQTYDFIGVPAAHHQISHHQGNEKNLDDLVRIASWEVEQYARLVTRLAESPMEDGSLLDSSLVYFGSEISDGDSHHHRDLPVLLAGGANGAHLSGVHRRFAEDRPIAELYLWMLHALGVEAESFGADGLTPLTGMDS